MRNNLVINTYGNSYSVKRVEKTKILLFGFIPLCTIIKYTGEEIAGGEENKSNHVSWR